MNSKILDNSLNRGNKIEILRWGFPDYSKQITVSASPYTAPCDGHIFFKFYYQSGGPYTIEINGTTVFSSSSFGGNMLPTWSFPVKKDDVVTYTISNDQPNVYFYPCFGCDYVIPPPPAATGYTTTGTAYVSDGVAAGFGWNGYLTPDYTFSPDGKAWEIKFSINPSELSPSSQFFFGTDDGETKGFVVGFYGLNPSLSVSTNGSSWAFENAKNTNVTIQANTKYYYKVSFDGNNTYSLGVSTDNVTYDTITQTAGTILDSLPLLIGACYGRGNNQYLRGTMELADMSISIDGNVVWTAV